MGAYLSAPANDKTSDDFTDSEKFSYGVSRMQGWRISMEDAHNCVAKLSENSSLFGVYDGHGGSEVAMYCALHFSDVLKDLQNFKDGKYEDALKETFMALDKALLNPDTIRELKVLADRDPDSGPVTEEEKKAIEIRNLDEEECEPNEMEMLHEEATMSIQELLSRYGKAANDMKAKLDAEKIKSEEGGSGSGETTASQDKKDSHDSGVSSSKSDEKVDVKLTKLSEIHQDSEAVSSSSSKGLDVAEKPGGSASSKLDDEVHCEVTSSTSVSKVADSKSSTADDNEVSSSVSQSSVESASKAQTNEADTTSGTKESCEPSSGSSKKKVPKKSKAGKLQVKGKAVRLGSGDDDDFVPDVDSDEESEDFDSDEAVEGSSESESEEEEDEDPDTVDIPSLSSFATTSEEPGKDSGTTAVVAFLNGNELYVANAGDSRCVLCRDGVAFDMSEDHKPEDDSEIKRIQAAGGHVNLQGRVNGGLNLSRAIGDHCYKTNTSLNLENQMISAMPDIKKVTLRPGDDFIVLACDGIWNVLSSQDVINFVLARLPESNDDSKLSLICEELMDTCLAPDTTGDGTGCDNMTCILVRFNKDWLGGSADNNGETEEKSGDSVKANDHIETDSFISKMKSDSTGNIGAGDNAVNGNGDSPMEDVKSASGKRLRTDNDGDDGAKKQKLD